MLGEYIRSHRVAFAFIVVLLIGLLGYGAYIAISRAGKEPVKVYLVPSDATLTANGERLGPGTVYLAPGKYDVKGSKEGFREFSTQVTIGKPNQSEIDIALQPVSEEAKKWAAQHQDLYLAYEGRAGGRANQEGEEFSKKNPITSKLPVNNFLYSIGYRSDTSDPSGDSIIIEIDALSGYRRAAIERIRQLGYDPTDFTIKFTNYENPFDE